MFITDFNSLAGYDYYQDMPDCLPCYHQKVINIYMIEDNTLFYLYYDSLCKLIICYDVSCDIFYSKLYISCKIAYLKKL